LSSQHNRAERLLGRTAYGGLDLASVSDLTAWVLAFPCQDVPEAIDVLARFWVPEAQVDRGENRHLYKPWVNQGWLYTTPGDAVDYGFIIRHVLEDAKRYDVREVNIDRAFQGVHVEQQLVDNGIVVFPMGQTVAAYAASTSDLERRLKAHGVHHGGNPILRWNVDSAEVTMDAEGRMKPDRKRARERKTKIDGLMALLMANDRLMRHGELSSVYDTRGVEFV
jgi:phage terminase large subunit-like protein